MSKRSKSHSTTCSTQKVRKLRIEEVEKRQLMAADLAAVDAPVDVPPPVALEAEISPTVDIESEQMEKKGISNGFPAQRMHAEALAIDATAGDAVFARLQQDGRVDDDLSGQGDDIIRDYRETIQSMLEEVLQEYQEKLAGKTPQISAPGEGTTVILDGGVVLD